MLMLIGSNFAIWFLVFEISLISVMLTLTWEGRAFRRLWAFAIMFLFSGLSAGIVLMIFNGSSGYRITEVLLIFSLSTALLIKLPSIPFSIWLPEAHVEATWPGSVLLAGFAMKFSALGFVAYGISALIISDWAIGLLVLGFLLASLAMLAVADAKKLLALFSVAHMSFSAVVLTDCSDFSLLGNLSWHHHSLVTGFLFGFIGLFYATSGSRLLRFLVGSSSARFLLICALFWLFTLSCDLPWTANAIVELKALKITFNNGSWFAFAMLTNFLAVFRWFIFSLSGITFRSVTCQDARLNGIFPVFLIFSYAYISFSLVAIGVLRWRRIYSE